MESLAGTSRTAGRRGGDSTFSSPAPSIRSLTTTLTTIQTATPNPNGASHNHTAHHHHHSSLHSSQAIHFSQPFPTASPASAIPPYLATSTGHPSTYATATANNLLTDDASILTLASSSRRRRRRSLDTDASIRAVAPSSLWGGSRESLPLSVLSANFDGTGSPATPGIHRSGAAGMSGAERASIYSATGIMSTAAASERNSFYAKQGLDAASVRSGLLGHNRTDSVNGSIVGLAPPTGQVTGASPLASPREVEKEGEEEEDEEEEKVAEEREKRKWKGKEKMKEKMKGKKTV
ncbi:hypothetical protein N0V88_000628 [Collariella sp. IMI 366227]|nr:hypothetical protein N0V88_000628 [Collariella sp. IMI 366227]